MKAKGRFISALFAINAAFGGYALGLNSRYVEVIDPSLPALKSSIKAAEPAKVLLKENKPVSKEPSASDKKHGKVADAQSKKSTKKHKHKKVTEPKQKD